MHIRWSRKGTWSKLFEALRRQGRPDLAEVFLDSTSMRAHAKAAGAKGDGYGTGACTICDGLGGIEVDHATIHRGSVHYASLLLEQFDQCGCRQPELARG